MNVGITYMMPPTDLATELTPWNAELVCANLFQLTEWVFHGILSGEIDIQTASREVIKVYERCLRWSKYFLDILVPEGGRTPFVIFVQRVHFWVPGEHGSES